MKETLVVFAGSVGMIMGFVVLPSTSEPRLVRIFARPLPRSEDARRRDDQEEQPSKGAAQVWP